MKLTDILTVLKEKELDADVIEAVEALDTSAEVERLTSELDAEKGKHAGILSDKKKYKERAETAERKVSEAERAKLPEAERIEQETQELKNQLAAEREQREADKAEFATTQRQARLSDITGAIQWTAGTPHETAKLIVTQALSGVEDLSDQEKVDEVLSTVRDSHKSFIAAEAPGGTGGKGGAGGDDDNENTGASSIADNQKAIWGDK